MTAPLIRPAKPGDEKPIHEAHMRSIREVCVKDHGEDEVRGWGNRPLGTRWREPIKEGHVWVVEFQNEIHGHGYIKIYPDGGEVKAHIHGLYLTPEVLGQGLGYALAKLMIEKAKAAGAAFITLDSSLTAHAFYQRLGFLDVGPLSYGEIGGSRVSGYPMMLRF